MQALIELLQTFWNSLTTLQLPAQLGFLNYLIISILVALEGPIVTLLGAAAASTGLLRPTLVFASAAAGNLAADLVWYRVGYAGKTDWLVRYGRYFGVKARHVNRLQSGMQTHATKVLVLAKLSAGLVIPTLIAAGLARVPWKRWLPALLLAETIWTGSLTLIGYYATAALTEVERGVEIIMLGASAIFLIFVFFAARQVLRHEPGMELDETENERENKGVTDSSQTKE